MMLNDRSCSASEPGAEVPDPSFVVSDDSSLLSAPRYHQPGSRSLALKPVVAGARSRVAAPIVTGFLEEPMQCAYVIAPPTTPF